MLESDLSLESRLGDSRPVQASPQALVSSDGLSGADGEIYVGLEAARDVRPQEKLRQPSSQQRQAEHVQLSGSSGTHGYV